MKENRFIGAIRKFAVSAGLVGVMAMGLAACDSGGGTPTNTPNNTVAPTSAPSSGGPEVKVLLKEWAIEPKTLEASAGAVRFVVSNDGEFVHNLVIIKTDGEDRTPNFKKDEGPKNLDTTLTAGTYRMVCDIPGHTERGMEGELVVK